MSSDELRKLIKIVEGYEEDYKNHRREIKSLESNGFDMAGRSPDPKTGEVGYWFRKTLHAGAEHEGRYFDISITFTHNNNTRVNSNVIAKLGFSDNAYTPKSKPEFIFDKKEFENIDEAIDWVNNHKRLSSLNTD